MNSLSAGLAALFGAPSLRAAALDALAVVAPTECSGCGARDRALCVSCVTALRADPRCVEAGFEPEIPVRCALNYRGVTRRVLIAYKELGRTDAAPALARALMPALQTVLDEVCEGVRARGAGAVELVTIPSTRAAYRERGYHPTELLLSHIGLHAAGVLRPARQTDDQALLTADARRVNRAGSLVARRQLCGRAFILVDDIVTTGATLREARRAILAAGGEVCGAAAVAHTVREIRQR